MNDALGARRLRKSIRASTVVTNVGSVFTMPPGACYRSAGFTSPTELAPVDTTSP
jgi:hypothetical protein